MNVERFSSEKIGRDSESYKKEVGKQPLEIPHEYRNMFGGDYLYCAEHKLFKDGMDEMKQRSEILSRMRLGVQQFGIIEGGSNPLPVLISQVLKKDGGTAELFRTKYPEAFETTEDLLTENENTRLLSQSAKIAHVMTQANLDIQLSPEILQELLRTHHELFLRINERFKEEILPKLKEVFVAELNVFIKEHSLEIDQQLVQERMLDIDVQLEDPLKEVDMGERGYFTASEKIIRLHSREMFEDGQSEEEILKGLKVFFSHEMLHAISGQQQIVSRDKKDQDSIVGTQQRRTGLAYWPKTKGKREYFGWLDEGVTQLMAEEISGLETDIYTTEKEIVSILFRKIPKHLFFNAYFETHNDANQEAGAKSKLKHSKKMWSTLAKTLGSKFMLTLDRRIKKKGSAYVAERLRNNPAFTMNESKD
ncbi:MAG: hypothetical protein ABIH21_00855 [Patescibacteria group bacterium]